MNQLTTGEIWCLVASFAVSCLAFSIGAFGWATRLIHALLG